MKVNKELKIEWIDSKQDIEKAFNSSSYVRQTIFEILNSLRYGNFNLYQTETNLNTCDLFFKAYWKSLSFSSSLEVVDNIEENRELLRCSIAVCENLTYLFIRSLQCHVLALLNFCESQELAISLMAETGEIAKKISTKYNEIDSHFRFTRDKVCKTLLTLTQEQTTIYERIRTITERSLISVLKKGEMKLEFAKKYLWKIQTIFLNTQSFWKQAASHSDSLADPALGDLCQVNLMQSESCNYIENELIDALKGAERNMVVISKIPQLKDVINSMKSGRGDLNITPTPFVNLFKKTEGIEEEFEKSFFEWLALAKVNQTMINSMEESLNGLNICRTKISQLETDELIKTLQIEAKHVSMTKSKD